jgi:hypothetical protein
MLIGTMIAALVFLFFPHSNALSEHYEETESLIKKYVHDETRQKQALTIIDQAETDAERRQAELKNSVESLANVLLNKRASTASEINAALSPIDAAAVGEVQKQLDLRFQLKTVLTESEWSEVFPLPGAKTTADGGTAAGT